MNASESAFPKLVAAEEARPILVVDDSRAQRRLLSRTLTKWGYETIEAGSGDEALSICASVDVDFVISDWLMPGLTGVEFCQRFRALKSERPAYFILLTAQTEREKLAEGLESGADDFLSKPFNVIELKARVRAGQRVLHAQRDLIAKNRLLRRTLDDLEEAQGAIERDLKEAHSFQQGLVPERFRALPGADLSILYQPSGHVGGDLVGMFPISENRYGVYALDVAGHGIASALMTARLAANLSAVSPDQNVALTVYASGQRAMLPPAEVCQVLNRLLLEESDTDKYLTMILAEIDLASGRIVMAQAGHPSPLLIRADGRAEYLATYGLPVGLIPGAEYDETVVQLSKGDRLILYSDGLTECPGPDGELLEEEGLRDMVLANRHLHGEAFVAALTDALGAFAGRTDFPDDLSAMVIERT
ncbi:SpoIIE family protein phosphatase [Alphaproteobacteria bacterium GH1-50]|uniref:SpoIIE family protein phosphatase n=1 Tax=Kangsaoukella pontilimi TaxID=2691042 RepID=A0A7C9IS44_9RHOB|nr:fused response regulator/phosphatase [Kangsaoukella pontilimi]MXQ08266.1 SpoIIE family protein phosphatase [Kangsaoukella pontilimi]